MSQNEADPLRVSSEGLPALNGTELAALIEIGEAGGMWPRHRLDLAAVRALQDAALVWPRGHAGVALTADMAAWHAWSLRLLDRGSKRGRGFLRLRG